MKNAMYSIHANAKSNPRGQAMVEFALVIPVIVLFTVAVMDLARAIYAYGVISNAARDGAHYGALDSKNTSVIESKTKAKTSGLEADRISVGIQCMVNDDNPYLQGQSEEYKAIHSCDPWNYLSVTVYYEFQPITLFFSTITMYSQSQMLIE